MRILFYSYAFPKPGQPGVGTFNRTMLAGLAAQHDVRVVSPVPFTIALRQKFSRRPAPAPKPHPLLEQVRQDFPTFYYPPKLCRHRYDDFLWWSTGTTLMAAVREFRPDLILSYWAHPDGAVAVRAGELSNVPTAVMVGGSDVLVLGREGKRRCAILNALSRASAVISVGDDIRRVLEADGLPPEKLHTVRRGVDTSVFRPGDRLAARESLGLDPQQTHLLGVGRLVDVKDWPTMLGAARHLADHRLNFHLSIVGSGPLHDSLQQQIERLGLAGHVTLRGACDQATLARWYRAADRTLLSSTSEGVPNVLMESIAVGTPFIATSVGGVSEIADPAFDRLVPPKQPALMAVAVEESLRPITFPEQGRQRRFHPDSLAEATERLSRVLTDTAGQTSPAAPGRTPAATPVMT